MLQEFTEQNYLIIEQNVVTNIVVWNGDTSIWTPPTGSIALIANTTPAKIWDWNHVTKTYELVEVMGAGAIGFTWDGTVLMTDQPQPQPAQAAPADQQPTTTGTTTA